MNRETVSSSLIKIMRPYLPEEININELDESKHLIEDLKINSAHIVDIVLDIEEEFDIMIEDDVIGKMNTVGDAIDNIMDKTAN